MNSFPSRDLAVPIGALDTEDSGSLLDHRGEQVPW